MRADRLVAIVLLLQTHGQMTAAALAERLEASERTIRRDLDSLSMAGVPVYSQRGRGGGWALLGGHRIDLSGLTVEEAQALFLVTGPGSVAGLGSGSAGGGLDAALRKVLAALPEPLRDQVVAARSAVLVDPARWGEAPYDPPHLAALRAAVVAGVQVDVRYARPGEEPAERHLHPHGLVCKRGVWYLVATAPAGLRTYRVSRVHEVRLTDLPADRPDGFDLAAEWDRIQRDLTRRSEALPVRLRAGPDGRARLAAVLGAWFRIEDIGQDTVTVWFPDAPVAARQLVALADRVEVLDPPEVRQELARLGAGLIERYGLSDGRGGHGAAADARPATDPRPTAVAAPGSGGGAPGSGGGLPADVRAGGGPVDHEGPGR